MIDAPIHIKVARMICENLIDFEKLDFDIKSFVSNQNIHKNHIEKTFQLLNEHKICTVEGVLTVNYKEKCFVFLKQIFLAMV